MEHTWTKSLIQLDTKYLHNTINSENTISNYNAIQHFIHCIKNL